MADILFSDITTGDTAGNGCFDVLMRSVKAHIQLEYDANRLKGTDYATVYLGAMQSAMQLAEQFILTEKLQEAQINKIQEEVDLLQTQDSEVQLNGTADRLIKAQQVLNEADKRLSTDKARAVQESQRRLYERQIHGFDDNKKIKAFESQLNAWALMFSSGVSDVLTPAGVITDVNLTASYNALTFDFDENSL
jgi:hypothetical protein